jgi:hypothetical protein
LAEYKIAPDLRRAMDSGVPEDGVVLAVSFPLLHNFSGALPGASNLPHLYHPSRAASEEWPVQLARMGMSATVTPGDPHHVKVSIQETDLHVSPCFCSGGDKHFRQ